MRDMLRVLIVEDSELDSMLTLYELKKSGKCVIAERVDTGETMADALKSKKWDLIISDNSMPKFSALKALSIRNDMTPELPFIIVSGNIPEEHAAQALKNGCLGIVEKDNLAYLSDVINQIFE